MSRLNDSRIMSLAALPHFIQRYASWRRTAFGCLKPWAEWFAIISGSIYVPVELYEIVMHVTWLRVTVLIFNLAIVTYLVYVRIWVRKHPDGELGEKSA